jgi:hypothetical protein
MVAGISGPFEHMQRISARLAEIALRAAKDGEVSLHGPLGLHCETGELANELSLNLLQNRIAAESQLSLKGVIVTNLVVNFWTESGQIPTSNLLKARVRVQSDYRPVSPVYPLFLSYSEKTKD